MNKRRIIVYNYLKVRYPLSPAFYYSHLFDQYFYQFLDSEIPIKILPNSIYLVYNIANGSPYLNIKTTLVGPSTYTIITSSTVTTINSYTVNPGVYTIYVNIYNPSNTNYVYSLGSITIAPNPAETGSTITIKAQVLNSTVTIPFIFIWRNATTVNVSVGVDYQYFFYDMNGNLVYSSPKGHKDFFTLAGSYLGGTITVIYAPAGISTISITANITGSFPPRVVLPGSFSTNVTATVTYTEVVYSVTVY